MISLNIDHPSWFWYYSPSLYVNQVFTMVRYKILYSDGDIICSDTSGRIRLSNFLFAVFMTFGIATSIKLLYISLKQYWSSGNNIATTSVERVVKYLINNPWVEYILLTVYFILYITVSSINNIACEDDDVIIIMFFIVGTIIGAIISTYIKKYGVNDSFGVRDEYLENAIFGLVVTLIGSIATSIDDGVNLSPINCLYRMIVLLTMIFIQYRRCFNYIITYKQPPRLNSIINTGHIDNNVIKIDNLPVAMSHSIELTFDFMMNWSELKEAFRKHIIKEFSGENLLFVDDAVAYKLRNSISQNTNESYDAKRNSVSQAVSISSNNMIQEAIHIYNTYIVQNANLQVNISAMQRALIDNNFKSKHIDCNVFNVAIKEIRGLMNNDSWTRFMVGDAFIKLSKQIPNRPDWQTWTY